MSIFPINSGFGSVTPTPNPMLLQSPQPQPQLLQSPTSAPVTQAPSIDTVLPMVLMMLVQALFSIISGQSNGLPNPTSPGTPVDADGFPEGASRGSTLSDSAPEGLAAFKKEIETAAKSSGVPADLLAGMIWQESRGNLAAVTINGGNGLTDTGLMQVNPNTYKDMQTRHPELQGRDDLSDPQTNILAGAFYIKEQIERFGSIPLALRAYNSGPNGVDVNDPSATPAGTGDPTYVDKVLNFYRLLGTGGTLPP